jgi:acyl carrier protein
MAVRPRKSTSKPDVDKNEPVARTTRAQTSTEATESGAAGLGAGSDVSDADNAGGGDGVTGKTNDGATLASRDGATGTPNAKAANISTKEGDAPQGIERDTGFSDTGSGPTSQAEASLNASMPAGVVVGKGNTKATVKTVTDLLVRFATKDDDRDPEEVTVFATTNIHDDLGIQRAEILDLAAEFEDEFGIDITPSEAQNFLLARDIANLVLRKQAAQAAREEAEAADDDGDDA